MSGNVAQTVLAGPDAGAGRRTGSANPNKARTATDARTCLLAVMVAA